jgi:hypothetical protein
MGSIRGRVSRVALLAPIFAALCAAPASATPVKPYSVVLTGGVATGSPAVTGTITNQNSQQQLGSANLTPPQGYTVTGVSVSGGTAAVVGNVVQLRNLNLAPGQPGGSVSVTITLSSVACAAAPWTVEAKQANSFSGPPGNDLGPLVNSNLVTTLCSAPCNAGSSCTTNASLPGGNASVLAPQSRQSGQLLESANSNTLQPLTCAGYNSADPNAYDVFATVDRTKVVTITITNPAVALTGSAQDILRAQQICFDAPYDFLIASGRAPSDGHGGFIGLLADCGRGVSGPCHDRRSDTTVPDPSSPLGFDIVLVANIPSGLPGDPHIR